MDFNYPISKVFHLDDEGYGKIDKNNMYTTQNSYSQAKQNNISYNRQQNDTSRDTMLRIIIDTMGELSTKAQKLKSVITSYSRLSNDQRLYIKAEGTKVFGFIKVGVKNLFHRDYYGTVREIKPLCVLDFYVHESLQRCGYGKMIYDHMIEQEKVQPSKLAYDRPSPLFISFLKKHFKLTNFVPQNNNFVIFNDYFESKPQVITNINQQEKIQTKNQCLTQHQKEIPQRQSEFSSIGKQLIGCNNMPLQPIQDIQKENSKPFLNFFNGETSNYERDYKKSYEPQQHTEIFNKKHINEQPIQDSRPFTNVYQQPQQLTEKDKQNKNQKEDKQLNAIQSKINKTEYELKAVSERISQLQLEQRVPSGKKSEYEQKFNVVPPWATTSIFSFPAKTSSQQYGGYIYEDFKTKKY